MNGEQQEQIKFLKNQLQRTKEQDSILVEIERKLYEMKAIAEYASTFKLSKGERKLLNKQLEKLKNEVNELDKQLHTVVH